MSNLENCDTKIAKSFNCDDCSGKCKVINVYDGDTITVAFLFHNVLYKNKCRLLGIDTPEVTTKNLVEKASGLRSKEYVKLLIGDKIVYIKFEGIDKYGRALGIIYLNETDYNLRQNSVNELLVTEKLAVKYDGGRKNKFSNQ